jgi:HSP20 family protein
MRQASAAWRPAIDISGRSDAYVVTIEGERHASRATTDAKVHRSERGYGVFRRSVTLPSSHVQADKTEATAQDGVLQLLVPQAPESQAGLIRVRVSQHLEES